MVDEIIVVDTGSDDGTRDVARSLGAKVFEFPWCDDFSAARNVSIQHATSDWIFWLDADDRIPKESHDTLRALFAQVGAENAAYLMNIISPGPDALPMFEHLHVRLFRNDPGIRWELRVHEQIAPSILRTGGFVAATGIALVHVGYADAQFTQGKLRRNLRLADLDCDAMPLNPVPLYGRAVSLLDLGRSAEALVALHLCEACADDDTIRRTLPTLKARAYILEDRIGDALETVRAALAHQPADSPLLFLHARLLAATGDYGEAEASLRAQLLVPGGNHQFAVRDHSLAQFRVRHVLAEVLLLQGKAEEAAEHANAVIQRRPMFGAAWLTLGEALLAAAGVDAHDALSASLASIPGTELGSSLLRSGRHIFLGEFPAAEALLTNLLAERPKEPCLLRERARLCRARGDTDELVTAAARAALDVDPLCARSRATLRSRRTASHSAAQGTWERRAALALSPLVKRDD